MSVIERPESEIDSTTGTSANRLGLGLVLIGAIAMAVAVFLPFAQPVNGLPIVGKNTLLELLGWHVLWPLLFIPYSGYLASQGKRSARWSLVGLCALAAVGVVALATAKSLRTMHIIGPGGPINSTGPGMLAGLDIAIYVAGAGVALASVGALALWHSASRRASGWQRSWPLAAAIVVVVAALSCYMLEGRPATTSEQSASRETPTSLTPAQKALERVLLSAEQIESAMGSPALTVKGTTGVMPKAGEQVPDKACWPIVSPAEAEVYKGSGWTSMVGQDVAEPGPRFRHRVEQTVVSFPSAKEAAAFYTASAQTWPACANRKFTLVMMGTNMPHTVGPVVNTGGILSVTQDQDGVELTFGCHRALTVANNIVVDVAACSLNPTAARYDHVDAAINIARQIAAKITAA
jgi:hypothetical protein